MAIYKFYAIKLLMNDFTIKCLVSGGIITNYFCTSKCRHCLYNCSPGREKKYMEPAVAEELLHMIRTLGCRSVHVGGGEPLLRPEKLEAILEVARRVGISIQYVETNSSWFQDQESAQELCLKLRRKGLWTLLVSISPFHNEYIPYSKVQGVIRACIRTDMNVFPWINGFVRDLTAFDTSRPHSLEAMAEKFGQGYLLQVLQKYWVHMGGRALNTYRPVLSLRSPQEIIENSPGGCRRELSDTSHFHVDLFGNYIPGLCSGLSIAAKDLGRPLSPERYPILTILVHSGIKGIFELAQNEFAYTPALAGYINKCDLCTEIRTVFVNHGFGGLSELNPKEFYAEMDNSANSQSAIFNNQ